MWGIQPGAEIDIEGTVGREYSTCSLPQVPRLGVWFRLVCVMSSRAARGIRHVAPCNSAKQTGAGSSAYIADCNRLQVETAIVDLADFLVLE